MKIFKKVFSTHSRLVSLGTSVLVASVLAARATVLVSIPFNYTNTASLPLNLSGVSSANANFVGNVGITGLFGQGSSGNVAGTLSSAAALAYTVSDSGSIIAAGASGLYLDKNNSPRAAVAYSSAISGQTVYVRFLYNPASTANRLIVSVGNSGGLFGVTSPTQPNTSAPRFDLNGTSWVCQDFAVSGVSANNSAAINAANANTTYLVVGRLNWDGTGYSSMDMWVNPNYNSGTPPSGYVTATVSGGSAYSSLTSPVFRFDLAGTTSSVAGFVIGTSWSDVVPGGVGHVPVAYNVSPTGSDANSGTNVASPFQTIQKAATVMLAGDTCYIRKGIYRETITPTADGTAAAPITFAPYAGEPVIVSGADVVNLSWSVHSNSIYKASTGLSFRQLFVDGDMMNEARWPNSLVDRLLEAPRATVGAGNTNTVANNTFNTFLVDSNLPNVNLTGATLHITSGNDRGEFGAFTRVLTNYDSVAKKISWASGWSSGGDGTSYSVRPGNPYYLYGALGLLDIPTEWFLDSVGGTLYLWTPDGASPASHTIEIKSRTLAFSLDNRSYVTLTNLYVFAAGISMANSTGCVVDNCHLRYVQHNTTADWAVDLTTPIAATCVVSGSGNIWRNTSLYFSSQTGLQLDGVNALVTNCVISRVDYYPGGGNYTGIYPHSGSGHKIIGNSLAGSGRTLATSTTGTQSEIAYNDMSGGESLTFDCGAFDVFNINLAGTQIHHNWIHNNQEGIYFDNWTTNGVVFRNVCYDNLVGIHLNTPGINHLVYNNTLIRNVQSIIPPFGTPNTQAGTQVINTLADSSMSFAADCTTNKNGWFPPVGANYVPQAGSGAIDTGQIIPGYTDGYSGLGPDIGAYEVGATYWTPGASFSIPPFPTPSSTVAPPAPTGLTSSFASALLIPNSWVAPNVTLPTASGIALSWVANPTRVSYYNIKRSTTINGTYNPIGTVVAGTSFNDTNVVFGQTYYYVVSAVNSSGESSNSPVVGAVSGAHIVIDDNDNSGLSVTGTWNKSSGWRGFDSYHNAGSGDRFKFTPTLPTTGSYQVYLYWNANPNRATNTPVDVISAGGTNTFYVNQQVNGNIRNLLGTFAFNAGTNGSVVVRDDGASGVVIADAVEFVQLPPPATPINFTGATVSGGSISLVATGAITAPYRLWGTSNLALPMSNWTVLVSNTISASPFTNTDLIATNSPQRFYRFSTP